MRKLILSFFVLGLIFIQKAVFAVELSGPGELFFAGNAAYKSGNYQEAISDYEKILEKGKESGNLYYNLGNAYFKSGNIALALVNYERARFFIPQDSDLQSNYEYLRSSLNLDSDVSSKSKFFRILDRLFYGASLDALGVILTVINIIFFGLLILGLFLPAVRRFLPALVIILASCYILSASSLSSKIAFYKKGAIIITNSAEAKFEPLENSTVFFNLSQGSRVEILEKNDAWYKIRRPDGKAGWLRKSDILPIRE